MNYCYICGEMQPLQSISYLGGEYTFHHLIALQRFGNSAVLVPCRSFDIVAENIATGKTDAGILAIDNNLAGIVKGNAERIFENNLHIEEELILSVDLHLAALPGVQIDAIDTVFSHPMAIKETKIFFSKHPHIQLSETSSTTEGVRRIAEQHLHHAGAIGNRRAIEHYGLQIISENIPDHSENYTRFFLLTRKETGNTTISAGKASIFFTADCTAGVSEIFPGQIVFSAEIYPRATPQHWLYAEIFFPDAAAFSDQYEKLNSLCGHVKLAGIYREVAE